jgi:hypothetical protein
MSELAFNLSGERFQPPENAAFWRVRRLKPGGRGAPEVVFGGDGSPLVIPVEAGLDDFRALVRNAPGRYRLDAVDEDQHACDGGVPAYLQISDGTGGSARSGDDGALVRELARSNADIVKTITEQFAGVIQAAAQLVRAADGAGLPAREPVVLQPRNAAPADKAEEDKDELEEEPLTRVLCTAVEQVMPVVNYAINTKVMGLTPEQALALLGKSPATPQPTASSETAAKEPARPATGKAAAPGDSAADDFEAKDFVAHLGAIEKLLTKEEVALVRAAVTQMTPEALAEWRQRIVKVRPEKAAELIRAEIDGEQS